MVSSCCVSEDHLGAFYNEDLRAGPSPRGADLLGPGNSSEPVFKCCALDNSGKVSYGQMSIYENSLKAFPYCFILLLKFKGREALLEPSPKGFSECTP